MKRVVFRGISLNEARAVVANQRYHRSEPRDFLNGVKAKSIFGSGLYLINDVELAAHYAYCHAELEGEQLAGVLQQDITLSNPFILNRRNPESKLRRNALLWKYDEEELDKLDLSSKSLELTLKIGNAIKEYLLFHGYDGIVYHIDEEIIYYVLYFQEEQVSNILYDFVFNIADLKENSVRSLREKFKSKSFC